VSEEKIGEELPPDIYVIGYGSLVWSREALAFLPMQPTVKNPIKMEDYAYTDEKQATEQADELKALGVDVEVHRYSCGGPASE
jgi:cation transport regulator ChaC